MGSKTLKKSKLIAEQLGLAASTPISDIELPENKNINLKPKETARAIAVVVNYIISDAFNLNEEENLWLSYNLNKVLKPLEFLEPEVVMGAVRRELETGEYSNRMFSYKARPLSQYPNLTQVRMASLEDWTTVISSAILASYPNIRPMVQASIVGSIYGLFSELGLTNDITTTRESFYLPNAVRYALNAKN